MKKTVPYVPGEQPLSSDIIKLNTNENPYPPSPDVIKAISQQLNDTLRKYPPPSVESLRKTIGNYYGVHQDQVFIGNGSDEVLAFSFMAFFDPGKPILFPDITYSFYPVYASLFQLDYQTVPLTKNFSIPEDGFYHSEGGVIFPNPNAPTGKYLSLDQIENILKHNPDQVVIIDEAYIDFGGESAVRLIDRYEQLLVIQTLSKSRSLAGLRVGYAIGSQPLIEGLNRIKNSFNSYTIDRLALAGAEASFRDEYYFQETCSKIVNTRKRVVQELEELGFDVLNSKTNFVFITHQKYDAEKLYQELKAKHIFVRYFNQPRINQYLRVSIGTDEEMNRFMKELKHILGN